MRIFSVFMILLFVAVSLAAENKKYPDLYDSVDPLMEQALDGALRAEFGMVFWKAVEAKKAGLAVVDITDLHQPLVAAINGDKMMYAASLPKIAILLGAFTQVERGEMKLDLPTRTTLTRMIRNSSNSAATEMLHRVGFANLAAILTSDRLRLYDPERHGGLWVGRDYGGGRVWKRDPLHNISHGATAMQVARFYYLLETDQLVSPEFGREMKAILSKPAIKHKFVKGMQGRGPADIYRKSGTWKQFHSDSGIIVRGAYRYIVVALAEHPRGPEGLTRFIVAVDDMMERWRPAPP